MDTSWITGELEPLDFCDATVPKNVTALGAQNIALNGCLCTNGIGYGVAIRTGNRTVLFIYFKIYLNKNLKLEKQNKHENTVIDNLYVLIAYIIK